MTDATLTLVFYPQEGTEDGTVVLIAGNKMDLVDEGQTQAVSAKDGTRLSDVSQTSFLGASSNRVRCCRKESLVNL